VEAKEIPDRVAAIPRFKEDVGALILVTSSAKPPLKRAQGKKTARAYYGFGDASGSTRSDARCRRSPTSHKRQPEVCKIWWEPMKERECGSLTVLLTSWFYCFMTGVHKQVGQVRKPDKEFTINVIHAVDRILEIEWGNARRSDEKKRIAEMGAWFIGGFCTGLRQEEMLLIELAGTATSLAHMTDVKNAHFVFVVSGRTKANQTTGAKFGLPCAPVTEGTHLRPGRWVKGLVENMQGSGCRGGRLFS
jgi:hypothetical protein